tara:strand:+ start:12996 stop:13553 length:558 start_codon:yes stop_codon:yes gene_type:complete
MVIKDDDELFATELEADEGSLFFKVELDEEHLPRSYAYRECRVCGRRLYQGSMVLRMRKYKNNYYCPSPKQHIQSEQEYQEELTRNYERDNFKLPSKDVMYSLVEAWAERKRRREAYAKLTAVEELVDKDGKILVDKDHENYAELEEAVEEIRGTKKLAKLNEEEAALEKRLREIAITKRQMKGK